MAHSLDEGGGIGVDSLTKRKTDNLEGKKLQVRDLEMITGFLSYSRRWPLVAAVFSALSLTTELTAAQKLPTPSANDETFEVTSCFDNVITDFMKNNSIPGPAAVVLRMASSFYSQGY